MDVARCLGESNLVNGDLLPILSVWWAIGQKSKHMTRIALACCESLGEVVPGETRVANVGSGTTCPFDLARRVS